MPPRNQGGWSWLWHRPHDFDVGRNDISGIHNRLTYWDKRVAFWGGIGGASALGTIGAINIYAMKKWGKTGSAILASKVPENTGSYNPFVSSLITGTVFGFGFNTATQIPAFTLSAVASSTLGVQVSLMLAGFCIRMVPLDTLDSILLRSAFAKMFNSKGFRYMSCALSDAP